MSWLLVAPILVPFVAAIVAVLARAAPALQRAASVAASALLTLLGLLLTAAVWHEGVIAGQMGAWPAPFGITLVADALSAVMVLITGVIGLAVAVYAVADIDGAERSQSFHPLFQTLLAGVCGAFLTGDLFNLYVWFEVMLIASFALLTLGGSKAQLDGGVKYVALNMVSTILFLTAIGLLYGMTGTLNMADLHGKVQTVDNQGLLSAVAVMFMVAFGIKAAMFPLFFWLPAAYHTTQAATAALFAGLLTKVGVYALLRTFTLIFTADTGYTHGLLAAFAALTMISGVLGAAAQNDFRRILSFHIVSQIGYMVMGLALYTPLALLGAVFYLVHHIVVKANLFLVSGVANRVGGSFELRDLGGLYQHRPLLALLFLVPAFSLAGFPPLSGFWAKLLLIQASLEVGAYLICAVLLVVGLLTIYSMTKIWAAAFWTPRPADAPPLNALSAADSRLLLGPIVGLAALTLLLGLAPQPLFDLSERAAALLLDPTAYVAAVLGSAPP